MNIIERYKKQAEAREANNTPKDRVKFWAPPSGRSVVRVIPFVHNDEEHSFAVSAWHWNAREGEHMPCPGHWDPTIRTRAGYGKWIPGPCPICKVFYSMDKDQAQKLEWDSPLRCRPNFYYNLVIRGDDGDELVTARLNITTHRQIDNFISTYAKEGHNILDLETGIDMIIQKDGQKMDTKYSVTPLMAKPVGIEVDPKDLIELQRSPRPLPEMEAAAKSIAKSLKVPY